MSLPHVGNTTLGSTENEPTATNTAISTTNNNNTTSTLSSTSSSTVDTILELNVVQTLIRNNADFVASVLREREHLERMNVAKVMLQKAYLEACSNL
jgi:hypothetical protein